MVVFSLIVMVMTTASLMLTLWCLSCGRFAYLSKCLLNSRYIGFVGVVGHCRSLSLKIEYNILYTILQILIKRNILQNLVATVLAMKIYIQHYCLFIRLRLYC